MVGGRVPEVVGLAPEDGHCCRGRVRAAAVQKRAEVALTKTAVGCRLVTSVPAAMALRAPMVTPGRMVQPPPIMTSSSTVAPARRRAMVDAAGHAFIEEGRAGADETRSPNQVRDGIYMRHHAHPSPKRIRPSSVDWLVTVQ